jgi:hypothetical protein
VSKSYMSDCKKIHCWFGEALAWPEAKEQLFLTDREPGTMDQRPRADAKGPKINRPVCPIYRPCLILVWHAFNGQL